MAQSKELDLQLSATHNQRAVLVFVYGERSIQRQSVGRSAYAFVISDLRSGTNRALATQRGRIEVGQTPCCGKAARRIVLSVPFRTHVPAAVNCLLLAR
jgi:hypothetical protein